MNRRPIWEDVSAGAATSEETDMLFELARIASRREFEGAELLRFADYNASVGPRTAEST